MKTDRLLPFATISVLAGLAAALLVLVLFSEDFPDLSTSPLKLGGASRPMTGPVSYHDAVEGAAPSVVNIYTTKVTIERTESLLNDPFFRRFFGDSFARKQRKKLQTSLGSGVIVNSQGFILTNHHVIADADEIRVVLSNGRVIDAIVAGTDPDTDLALLQAATDDLPAITVGNSEDLRVGDVVLAIGNPFGVGQTVTMGIVSATGRNQLGINTFENFIQTDAAINPGNSGGALINAYGELIGINTAIFSESGGSQGIGFAIPITLARGVMNQILIQGRVVRGWLGIAGQDVTPQLAESFGLHEARGVLVSGVLEDGPADQAGIQPGDVITRINNRVPGSVQQILEIISGLAPGSSVQVYGWRGDKPLKTEVIVSERPRDRLSR